MKKLILTTILALFFAVAGLAQYQQPQQYIPDPNQIPTVNVTSNQFQNGWARNGNTCAGCPSYFIQVIRSQQMIQAENGQRYYYFFLYFYSNSYYTNGSPAGTYLSQVNYYLDQNFIFNSQYILVPAGQKFMAAWMRSTNLNSMVSYTSTNMSVY